MPKRLEGTLTGERIFLVSSSDPNFSLIELRKHHEFKVEELLTGTHVIKVGNVRSHKYEPWIDYDLKPKTIDGAHALIQIILHLTANYHDMTIEQLCGRDMRRSMVNARKIAAYLCCDAFRTPVDCESGLSSPFVNMIAANMARERTMIHYYDNWVRDRLDIIPDFVASIAILKGQILSRLPIDEKLLAEKLN